VANFVFNVARGRVRQYYDIVKSNAAATGPTTGGSDASLAVLLIATASLEADATLADYDNLSLLIAAAGNDELSGGTYVRKFIDDTTLVSSGETDATNVLDLDVPDIVWTALTCTGPASNSPVSALLICYKPTAASADTAIIPLTKHDFVVTPDGTDVTAQIAATGFYRSS
jgi:hypothetical protein